MSLLFETSAQQQSLQELYHDLSDVFHYEDLFHEHLIDFGIAISLTVLFLVITAIAGFLKLFELKKHRALIQDGVMQDTDPASIWEEPEYSALVAVSSAIAVFFVSLIVVSIIEPPSIAEEHHTVKEATHLSATVQSTVQEQLKEDYTIVEITTIAEPDESYHSRAAKAYREEIAQWAQDFYRTPTQDVTIDVVLEDDPNSIYSYQLWYDRTHDRARLMDSTPDKNDSTAPPVESIARGGVS